MTTGIEESTPINTVTTSLLQLSVEPNLVLTNTEISYGLNRSENVDCAIYDAKGSLITNLINGKQNAGQHRIAWNTNGIKPGVYFCKLITTTSSTTARLIVIQ